MTDTELDEWERLANAATPESWERLDADGFPLPGVGYRIVAGSFFERNQIAAEGRRDAAFIAATRTAVPRLIAEVRRLQSNGDWLGAYLAMRSRAEAAEARIRLLGSSLAREERCHAMEVERRQTTEAERDALRAALAKYGRHDPECVTVEWTNRPGLDRWGYEPPACNCGLDAALAAHADQGNGDRVLSTPVPLNLPVPPMSREQFREMRKVMNDEPRCEDDQGGGES